MRFCFGSFSMTLLKNKKNNAVTKITVGRELLRFISPDYVFGKDDRYIYYFMDEERELPKELKEQMTDLIVLGEQFSGFIDKNIGPDRESLLLDMTMLVQEDDALPEHVKIHLLELSKELKLPAFLAELFVFAVDSTHNKAGGAKPRVSRKRFNLLKEIGETVDNEILYNLAQLAIQEQDIASLTACLKKMTNNVYIARALVYLSQDQNFADHPDYIGLFHTAFSGMENNKYRYKVFEGCLGAGYYKEHPESLLEAHLHEHTNNRYMYDALILLCELGMQDYMEKYRHLLTNKTYAKRLDAYLSN